MNETSFYLSFFKKDTCPEGWIRFLIQNESNYKQNHEKFVDLGHKVDMSDFKDADYEFLFINIEKFDSFEKFIRLLNGFLNMDLPVYDYGSKWAFVKPSNYYSIFALPLSWIGNSKLIENNPDFLNRTKPSKYMMGDSTWTITRNFFPKNTFGLIAKDSSSMIRRSGLVESNAGTKNLTCLRIIQTKYSYEWDQDLYPIKLVCCDFNQFGMHFSASKVHEVAFESDLKE